ncbi:MAG TPA: hypothetical protein VIF62_19705, partial [Labilithrix sp.]
MFLRYPFILGLGAALLAACGGGGDSGGGTGPAPPTGPGAVDPATKEALFNALVTQYVQLAP